MTNQHYGKISEGWKHGVLAEVLDTDRPRRFAETHAGSADYRLVHSSERDYGFFRFLDVSRADEVLGNSAYRRTLDRLPTREGVPTRCPGSPLVAMAILGDRADYLFFDTDEASIATIDAAAHERALGDRVRAFVADGVAGVLETGGMRATGACAHVDPFEPDAPSSPGGISPVEAARALASGGATVLFWYGVEDHPMWAWDAIASSTPDARWWIGELRYAEPETDSGITACGMLLANVSAAAIDRCERYAGALVAAYREARLPSANVGSLSFSHRRS